MRKESIKYLFSVEGETEKWYLQWLQRTINSAPGALYTVKLDCPVQKDPLKRAKALITLERVEIFHIMDRESEDEIHIKQFNTVLSRMNEATKIGKSIKYSLGYSNFSFELWIVLHKADCGSLLNHRYQYLPLLNRAYNEQFENLHQYKHEVNFKRILDKLTLDDVIHAILRAESIMRTIYENGYTQRQYKGYKYYSENPSLSVWEIIKKILSECGLSASDETTNTAFD